jgi:glycerol dehydrogenase-like iron-containing ADH family enzyme
MEKTILIAGKDLPDSLDLADGILKRDEKSIKALMEALVVIGILMSFAGLIQVPIGAGIRDGNVSCKTMFA